jgi:protein TonB
MFEELVETQSSTGSTTNRRSYFVGASAVLIIALVSALIVSLFAMDFDVEISELDMLELVLPVDAPREEKRPELETAPTAPAKQPGPSAAPVVTTRQANIARLDESPTVVPSAISTAAATLRSRTDGFFKIGKFDNDAGNSGAAGRGLGGSGTGDSEGLSTGTVAATSDESEAPPPVKKPIEKSVIRSLGIVNGRATSLPKPAVPAAARVANALGTVAVQVLIDENGNVISANAVSGSQLLRQASEMAAKQAKFNPTLLGGEKVRASGIINYHFS